MVGVAPKGDRRRWRRWDHGRLRLESLRTGLNHVACGIGRAHLVLVGCTGPQPNQGNGVRGNQGSGRRGEVESTFSRAVEHNAVRGLIRVPVDGRLHLGDGEDSWPPGDRGRLRVAESCLPAFVVELVAFCDDVVGIDDDTKGIAQAGTRGNVGEGALESLTGHQDDVIDEITAPVHGVDPEHRRMRHGDSEVAGVHDLIGDIIPVLVDVGDCQVRQRRRDDPHLARLGRAPRRVLSGHGDVVCARHSP